MAKEEGNPGTVKEALQYGKAGVKYNKDLTNEQKQQVSLYNRINQLQKEVTDRVIRNKKGKGAENIGMFGGVSFDKNGNII